MSEDHDEHLLAEALEEYHRRRARGEKPDEDALRARLGGLYEEFLELVAAETLIDRALDPPPEDETHLPMAWGAYTILREIARGGAGVVYEAMHRKLGRKVALKVLRTGIDTDARARERFVREARALAQVKHENIVEIYEFGEVDGRPFYAMSLVDGRPLIDLVKDGPATDIPAVCRGLADIADALATLHEAGIIHRDVKPQNIIVDRSGRYMLADFGLARTALAETMTQTGDAVGTPLYMSPEQMLGDRDAVDTRSDIYGLGATLYQLLAGVPPFQPEDIHALYSMIKTQRPAPPREVAPEVPRDLENVALKCLEKRRRDRYATVAEVGEELRAHARGDEARGRPVGRMVRMGREIAAHPVLTAAALVLAAFGLWAALRPPEPAVLTLATNIAAEASLNHDDWRPTPWTRLAVPSEREHVIEIHPKDPAYRNRTLRVRATPGGDIVREILLEPKDLSKTPEALDALRDVVGVEPPEVEAPEGTRSGAPYFAQVLGPRGRVRRDEDLQALEVAVGGLSQGPLADRRFEEGAFVFLRGGEELARIQAPATSDTRVLVPIPESVRERLAPGDALRVAYRLPGVEKPIDEADLEIVAPDPELPERIQRARATVAEHWTADPEQADMAARILVAELLLDADLPYAAHRTLVAPFERRNAALLAAEREAETTDAAKIARLRAEEAAADNELLALGVRPTDPAEARAYDERETALEARRDRAGAALEAYTAERNAHDRAPESMRSLQLLSLEQLALERMYASSLVRQESELWSRLQTWRGMFDREAWERHLAR